jgi:hypothetical protein
VFYDAVTIWKDSHGQAVVKATNGKIAGLIPRDVIGIIRVNNPAGRTMTLGSTQPLTEVSTRTISCTGIAFPLPLPSNERIHD